MAQVTRVSQIKLDFHEDDVGVLKGLEAVREKTSMYIGPTDDYGIFTITREPGDNVRDEFRAGRATACTVQVFKDGYIAVHDDGQGMPVGLHKTEKVPTIQVLVGTLHAGGKLRVGGSAYKHAVGSHGIGVKATNGCSEVFQPFTFRDGSWWTLRYEKGVLRAPLQRIVLAALSQDIVPVYKQGTIILFKPDKTIFDPGSKLVPDMLYEWAKTTAYLNAGFSITIDIEGRKPQTYAFDNGINDWLDHRIEQLKCVEFDLPNGPLTVKNDNLEMVVTFTDADGCQLSGFCNGLYQNEGGNHVNTTLSALFASIKEYAPAKAAFSREDIAEGVLGVVNFMEDAPRFGGQTKNKLTDPRFDDKCKADIEAEFKAYWLKNKVLARELCKRASELRGAKESFTLSKDAMRKLKSKARDMGRMPGKLAMVKDCKPEDRELYLVEGESAAGCFTGNTEVLLADGSSMRFDEMVKQATQGKVFRGWAYDTRSHQVVEMEFDEPRITKYVSELIEVELEDGTLIQCTTDHPWLSADGETYISAEKLVPGQALLQINK